MSIDKLPSGHYRVRVMKNGRTYSKTFDTELEAQIWETSISKNPRIDSGNSKEYDRLLSNIYKQQNTKRKNKQNTKLLERKELPKIKVPKNVENELRRIDEMNGFEFEEYCCSLLNLSGLFPGASISTTKEQGDYGADIIIECINGVKVAIQCKRYSKSVGIDAIQEVCASKSFYETFDTAVITNSSFTPQAQKLAAINNVYLIDRAKLIRLIQIQIKYLDSIVNGYQWHDFIDKLNEESENI